MKSGGEIGNSAGGSDEQASFNGLSASGSRDPTRGISRAASIRVLACCSGNGGSRPGVESLGRNDGPASGDGLSPLANLKAGSGRRGGRAARSWG